MLETYSKFMITLMHFITLFIFLCFEWVTGIVYFYCGYHEDFGQSRKEWNYISSSYCSSHFMIFPYLSAILCTLNLLPAVGLLYFNRSYYLLSRFHSMASCHLKTILACFLNWENNFSLVMETNYDFFFFLQ